MLPLWHRKDGQGTLRNWTLTLVLTGCCPVPQPCSASSASAAKALEQGAQEAAWLEPLEETFKLVSFPERRQVWIPPQLQAHCITVAFVGDTTICMSVGALLSHWVQIWQVGHRTPLGKAAGTIIMRLERCDGRRAEESYLGVVSVSRLKRPCDRLQAVL